MIIKAKKETIKNIFDELNSCQPKELSLGNILSKYKNELKEDYKLSFMYDKDKLFIKSRYEESYKKYGEMLALHFVCGNNQNVYSALLKKKHNQTYKLLQTSFISLKDLKDNHTNVKIGYYFDYEHSFMIHKEDDVTIIYRKGDEYDIYLSKSLEQKFPCSNQILKSLFKNFLNNKSYQEELDMLLLMGDVSEINSMLAVDQSFISDCFLTIKEIEKHPVEVKNNKKRKNK